MIQNGIRLFFVTRLEVRLIYNDRKRRKAKYVGSREVIDAIDQMIRAGKIAEARKALDDYRLGNIRRSHLEAFAQLFIRVGWPQSALRILYPIVRSKLSDVKPTPHECASYALALLKIGSFSEAETILSQTHADIPELELCRGSARQMQWDYEGSIVHLQNYVNHPLLKDRYSQAVARLNLVAAHISCSNFATASSLLDQLAEEAAAHDWTLLTKNMRELRAQVAVHSGDYERAEYLLNQAALNPDIGFSDLMIQKWKLFCEIYRAPSETAVAKLKTFRATATIQQHWETVRECDRVIATVARDQDIFNKIYFGTPFPAYKKMLRKANPWFQPTETFVYGDTYGVQFDLRTASCANNPAINLKPGMLVHRVLTTLFQDLYRPQSSGSLFAAFFPGDCFNPLSAPTRLGTVMYRTRKWAERVGVPLTTELINGFHHVKMGPGLAIVLSDSGLDTGKNELGLKSYIERLRSSLQNETFGSRDVAKKLEISKAKATKFLGECLSAGLVSKSGASRTTRYKLCA